MSAAFSYQEGDVPILLRGVRVEKDVRRDQHVLQVPEKAIALDEIGVAILSRVDGKSSLAEISGDLARQYDAPLEEIMGDVTEFLSALRAKVYLGVAR